MGRFVGEIHKHDTPLAMSTNAGKIWECNCGQRLACIKTIVGRKPFYSWVAYPKMK